MALPPQIIPGHVYVRRLDGDEAGPWVDAGEVVHFTRERLDQAADLADVTWTPSTGDDCRVEWHSPGIGWETNYLEVEPSDSVLTPEANYRDLGAGALLSEILGTIDGAFEDEDEFPILYARRGEIHYERVSGFSPGQADNEGIG